MLMILLGVGCTGTGDSGASVEWGEVSAGFGMGCGLQGERVECWGEPKLRDASSTLGIVAGLSVGQAWFCGLDVDDRLVCGGLRSEAKGELADVPEVIAKQVSLSEEYGCVLESAGSVVCWGDPDMGRTAPPGGSFESVSAGTEHACGVSGGELTCWGVLHFDPYVGEEVVDVASGHAFSCVLTDAGDVSCAGIEGPRLTEPAVSVSGRYRHACALLESGAVVCWGDDRDGETVVPEGLVFEQVSAGNRHSCGLTVDAAIECWGAEWAFEGLR